MDLNLLTIFSAVAQAGNFRAAADRLGVTRSAVSQGIRRLEHTLGKPLFNRTTRSVRLTEEGEQLLSALSDPMAEIAAVLEATRDVPALPRGLLRVAVTSIAERFLSGPLIATFIEQHPHITLDVTVTDETFDIVAGGFDAGIRLGEVIDQDMIAMPLTGEQRQVALATPDYLARHGMPQHAAACRSIPGIWRPIAVLDGVPHLK